MVYSNGTIYEGLWENDILVESWGGKVQSVEISALNGDGVDSLLDSLLLETEILDLKANLLIVNLKNSLLRLETNNTQTMDEIF